MLGEWEVIDVILPEESEILLAALKEIFKSVISNQDHN